MKTLLCSESGLLTDLLGYSEGLLWGAGHHAVRHRDTGLFEQANAHVFVQGEVPLLLLQVGGLRMGHMTSKQTCGTTKNLKEKTKAMNVQFVRRNI